MESISQTWQNLLRDGLNDRNSLKKADKTHGMYTLMLTPRLANDEDSSLFKKYNEFDFILKLKNIWN